MTRYRALLCILITVPVLLLAHRTAVSAATNSQVTIVNLSDHNFWVYWYTDVPVGGSILLGPTCDTATVLESEEPSDGFVHLVNAGGSLHSATQYAYRIMDGADLSPCMTVMTLPKVATRTQGSSVTGTVRFATPACDTVVGGGLVTLTVTHGGTTSLPLAVVTSSAGAFAISLGSVTDVAGNPITPATGDTLTVGAALRSGDVASTTVAYNPPPSGPQVVDLCLPSGPGDPAATPTPTPSPTATATAVPTAAAEPTATPAPVPPHIHIRAHLAASTVRRGARQWVYVTTDAGASIRLVVTYSDKSHPYVGYGKAPRGSWSRHWIVRTSRPGTGAAQLRVTESGHQRYYTLRFQIR